MAFKDDDNHQTQASEPLLTTDVERVEVVAPAQLPEGYGLEVTTSNEESGQISYAQVRVVRMCWHFFLAWRCWLTLQITLTIAPCAYS